MPDKTIKFMLNSATGEVHRWVDNGGLLFDPPECPEIMANIELSEDQVPSLTEEGKVLCKHCFPEEDYGSSPDSETPLAEITWTT